MKASSLVPDVLLSGSTDEQLRVWDLTSKASAEELAAEREKASKLRSLNGQANDADESGTVLISLVEGHWHEISSIDIWWRIRTGELESDRKTREDEESRKKGETRVGEGINKMTVTKEKGSLEGGGEWWIVTSSLDGSIRRWKLSGEFWRVKATPSSRSELMKPFSLSIELFRASDSKTYIDLLRVANSRISAGRCSTAEGEEVDFFVGHDRR